MRIVEDLACQPTSSVPQACGSVAATTAAYDFWSSPYFEPDDIRIEELQLETAKRINMALATYSIVAWRLLWLTYEARHNPDISCETVLDICQVASLQL